jgi:hypothetical protein
MDGISHISRIRDHLFYNWKPQDCPSSFRHSPTMLGSNPSWRWVQDRTYEVKWFWSRWRTFSSYLVALGTGQRNSRRCSSNPRSTWRFWPANLRWPSINSTGLPRRMYCYNQRRYSSSLARRTSDFSGSTPTGHSLRGSTETERPSRSNVPFPEQNASDCTADQSSQTLSPRISGDSKNEVISAQLHVLARNGSRHWRNVSSMPALCWSSSKTAPQSNTDGVASSNKT